MTCTHEPSSTSVELGCDSTSEQDMYYYGYLGTAFHATASATATAAAASSCMCAHMMTHRQACKLAVKLTVRRAPKPAATASHICCICSRLCQLIQHNGRYVQH